MVSDAPHTGVSLRSGGQNHTLHNLRVGLWITRGTVTGTGTLLALITIERYVTNGTAGHTEKHITFCHRDVKIRELNNAQR